ncbi:MAG: AEC family transporter, partial [Burkholderiaceae bacterium]
MLDILAITGPIYITIALGYFLTRRGLFARADMRVLGQFVINLALPALLFNALAQRKLGDILNGRYMLVYAIGSLVAMGLGLLWARRGARQDANTSVFWAMGMSCPNSGFVGYPIALLVVGPVAGVMLGLNMIVENLLLIPLLLALAESSSGGGGRWHAVLRQSLVNLARNPMVLGLAAGFAVSALEWQMPSPVARTVTLFAQASAALSLFVIGGSLAGLHIAGLRRPVAQIAIGKLLLHPA